MCVSAQTVSSTTVHASKGREGKRGEEGGRGIGGDKREGKKRGKGRKGGANPQILWPKTNLVTGFIHIHIHTHPFNGPLSRTTQVSW